MTNRPSDQLNLINEDNYESLFLFCYVHAKNLF